MHGLPEARTAMRQEDYRRALEVWSGRLPDLVRNVNVVPHWIGNEDRFWFKQENSAGHRFRLVDAATGATQDAFDHARVAAALTAQGVAADLDKLPLTHFELSANGSTLIATTPQGGFRIDLLTGTASPYRLTPPTEVPGPDGHVLFLRDHDLWLRTGDGSERALTQDGEPFNAWGVGNDYNTRRVATNRGDIPPLPTNLFWSPDGRMILAERVDERAVEPYPYIEFVPLDGSARPKLHFIRETLVGEKPRPDIFVLIDLASGGRVELAPLPDDLRLRPDLASVWWSEDGRHVSMVALTVDASVAALVEFDRATGAHRIVHREDAATYFDFNTYLYNLANVRLRPNARSFIWYSQQDGWGHLYTVDQDSGAIQQLTQGAWAVADIIAATDTHLFFTAVGREAGRNPYYRHLYRIDLDAGEPNAGLRLLTPDDADHGFPGEPTPLVARILNRPAGLSQMSPSARYFVDAVSRVDLPPRFLLRDADGDLIAEIARADVTDLTATGWHPPETFSAKAADGETDLYGVLIKPRSLDPAARYPVIENIYGGPQIIAQPRSFLEGLTGAFMYGLYTLADLGFVVAIIDGPGTPYRSKRFHDFTYGATDRWGIAHHRAALEEAAATRPWMDMSRVGVRGHSFGGYGAVQAMLHQPGFYKVGVSSAGIYDLALSPSGHEPYLGPPDYGDGRRLKRRSDEVAPNHWEISPSRMVDRLSGRLLLAAGDLDENIQPAGLFALVSALIKGGKDFDQLVLPGRSHGFSGEAWFQKRTWDYFIEHLQGRAPLRHFLPDMKPGVRAYI